MKIVQLTLINLLLLCGLLLTPAADAKIRFVQDRVEIRENETFKLRILVDDTATLAHSLSLNFLPPELERLSLQQFNNSTMINNRFYSEMGWEIKLLAKQAGTYTIPPQQIGRETSDTYTLRILPPIDELKEDDSPAKVKLRATVNLDQVYVQQQLILTVRVYRSVVTRHESLTLPKAPGALVEQLGDERSFEMVQGNTTYRVVERQFALFPQQSGELVIEPMTYSATILDDSTSNNPWGLSKTKPISLSSPQFKVEVKSKPKEAEEPWLPATNLSLEANWQPANQGFTVGEPATLVFKIKGTGLLQTQLPDIEFPEVAGLKIYRDAPEYQQLINRLGVTSHHIEKLAVVPSKAGTVALPEIRIPWWNTISDEQDYAVLPAMTIEVQPAKNQIQVQPMVSPKLEPINNSGANTSSLDLPVQNQDDSFWKITTLVLAGLWLLTLTGWLLTRSRPSSISAKPQQKAADASHKPKANIKAIERACSTNDPHQVQRAILNWCQAQPHLKMVNNLDQLIQLVDSPQLNNQLQQLQAALYSSTKADRWNGQALAQQLEQLPKPATINKPKGLPKLYS